MNWPFIILMPPGPPLSIDWSYTRPSVDCVIKLVRGNYDCTQHTRDEEELHPEINSTAVAGVSIR